MSACVCEREDNGERLVRVCEREDGGERLVRVSG